MSDSEVLTGAALGDINQLLNASADECGPRVAIVPSPGTNTNYVVLIEGPKAAGGIGFVQNTGRCELHLHGLDANGKMVPGVEFALLLPPGEKRLQFGPVPGAQKIVAVSSEFCFEHSEIQWDPCAGIV